jgi:hypothetical protein
MVVRNRDSTALASQNGRGKYAQSRAQAANACASTCFTQVLASISITVLAPAIGAMRDATTPPLKPGSSTHLILVEAGDVLLLLLF